MHSFIYVTAANEGEAEKIAENLVGEKLAACSNIFPIKSVYTWKGTLQKENEIAMLVKTRTELVDKAIKRIKELHSYEVPCIVSFPIKKGNPEFLKWIDEATKN